MRWFLVVLAFFAFLLSVLSAPFAQADTLVQLQSGVNQIDGPFTQNTFILIPISLQFTSPSTPPNFKFGDQFEWGVTATIAGFSQLSLGACGGTNPGPCDQFPGSFLIFGGLGLGMGVSTIAVSTLSFSTFVVPFGSEIFTPFPVEVFADLPDGFSLASAVPEPSTWAMLLIGFVGLGFVFNARSRKTRALARA